MAKLGSAQLVLPKQDIDLQHVLIILNPDTEFFLFFTISTYGSLIPNDRVITDVPEDYDLLEGIIYNIVHNMSDLNLVSSDEYVTVAQSNDSDPYQRWSLRKVKDNIYNIVNIGSGTNLDNNGDVAYVSSHQNNFITNENQHWTFRKIRNNTYNIANMKDETRNSLIAIDSNGTKVYILPSDKDNLHQQWLFEPINYELTTVITDFDLNYDDTRNRNKKQINLLSGNNKILNPTNVTIEQTVDRIETKSNSFSLEIRRSESFKISAHIDLHFEIGVSVFDILQLKAGVSGGIEGEIKSTVEERNKGSVTDKVSYHIQHKVIVPPYTSVQVIANVDKVDLVAPFNAKIKITCKADRLSKSGQVVKMTDVDVNVIKYYFQRENSGGVIIDGDLFYINTNGTLKIDGYGFDSEIKTINIETFKPKGTPSSPSSPSSPLSPLSPFSPSSPSSPSNKSESTSESSPKNLVLLYQVILTLFQIIMLLQIQN
ncbi:hypothetical protein RhiirB3_382823 [Rhizophagus irregularis]|nr:hypothetical protein RhiirB3_382823 [Rhizophagus irregularis]